MRAQLIYVPRPRPSVLVMEMVNGTLWCFIGILVQPTTRIKEGREAMFHPDVSSVPIHSDDPSIRLMGSMARLTRHKGTESRQFTTTCIGTKVDRILGRM